MSPAKTIGRYPGHCPHCGGQPELVIKVDLDAVLHGLGILEVDTERVLYRLGRIEQALRIEGVTLSEIDDRLAQVTGAITDLAADVDRELADLKTALSGNLSADQEAAFDSVLAKVAAIKDAVDTADPAPASEPPAGAAPSEGAEGTPLVDDGTAPTE
jgi:hypothetical protein